MEELQEFKDAITPFLPTWKGIEVKAIADLDMGAILSMVACLSPDDVKPLEVTDPIQGIVFIRETLPISELDKLLEGWKHGSISLGQYQLTTSEFSNARFLGLSSGWDDLVRGWPEFRAYRQFMLQSYGSRNLDVVLHPKDTMAIARVLGFNSFEEWSSHRVQFQVGGAYVTRLEIFAPVFAVVETKAEATKVQLSIKMHHALQSDDLKLSYRVQDQKGNRLAGGSLDINQFAKTASRNFTILKSTQELPPESTSGEVHLFHRLYKSQAEPIASAHFTAPALPGATNPRWDLLVSIIENTRTWSKLGIEPEETIKQWLGLTSPRPKQDDFERGIAILFFAAGLVALSIGEAEGVDKLVFLNERQKPAIVVSCTTSPDLGKKIASLSMQRNRVKEKLSEFSVEAAILAPVEERDLIGSDIDDCRDQRINLVLRPDIQALFEQVRGRNWSQSADSFIQILTRSG